MNKPKTSNSGIFPRCSFIWYWLRHNIKSVLTFCVWESSCTKFFNSEKTVSDTFFSIPLCFVSKRSVNIRFFPKFAQFWRGLSPSSRGVRSSDWMIIKAEALICRMPVSPLSDFFSEKSYSGSKTHTKPKKAIHTPTQRISLGHPLYPRICFKNEKTE